MLRVLAVVLIGAAACRSEPAPPAPDPSEPPSVAPEAPGAPPTEPAAPAAPVVAPRPAGPLNVLLLTIDSLRAEMPWTGYSRSIAPNLTKLAERGVVYTHAYAVSSYTAKSVGALLSGRYPASLYRSGYFFTGYSDDNLFFTEVLSDKGVRCIGGHAHMYFGRGKNLNQGFHEWELVPGITFDSETDNHVTSHKLTALAQKLLGDPKNTGGQFFAWFHYMDPHDKYVDHEEAPTFGKTGRDRYDAEVFYTDLHVGKLLDWAEQQPWWQNTVVIVSADHGEAFGEHDFYRHAFWLWEAIVRVPLLVAGPGIEARRIDQRRSHIDLAPTILDLMGHEGPPEVFVGQTLAPEIFGEEPPQPRKAIVLDLPEDSHNPPIRAVIQGDTKLIVYGAGQRYELFQLDTDPEEKDDLSKKDPERLAQMKAFFEATWAEIPQVEPFGNVKLRSGRIAKGPRGPGK
jgi:choline-sulfatase